MATKPKPHDKTLFVRITKDEGARYKKAKTMKGFISLSEWARQTLNKEAERIVTEDRA